MTATEWTQQHVDGLRYRGLVVELYTNQRMPWFARYGGQLVWSGQFGPSQQPCPVVVDGAVVDAKGAPLTWSSARGEVGQAWDEPFTPDDLRCWGSTGWRTNRMQRRIDSIRARALAMAARDNPPKALSRRCPVAHGMPRDWAFGYDVRGSLRPDPYHLGYDPDHACAGQQYGDTFFASWPRDLWDVATKARFHDWVPRRRAALRKMAAEARLNATRADALVADSERMVGPDRVSPVDKAMAAEIVAAMVDLANVVAEGMSNLMYKGDPQP